MSAAARRQRLHARWETVTAVPDAAGGVGVVGGVGGVGGAAAACTDAYR